ncbi:MAG TPA: hypothetical protein VM537_28630 [Anaerolineae bacterium]|nr:hypothetical protein [Anaerolineae bacterium]
MLMSFAPVFTKPSFDTFRQYLAALMLGEGRRTGAAIVAVTDLAAEWLELDRGGVTAGSKSG